MSSRALRRLQKELELEKQIAAAKAVEAEEEGDEDDEVDSEPVIKSQPQNAFDMLEGAEEEGSDESDGPFTRSHDANTIARTPSMPTPSVRSKKKKRKPKKKGRERGEETAAERVTGTEMDEIDRALKELKLNSVKQRQAGRDDTTLSRRPTPGATKLLGIESKNLNPLNEMKSLFGNIALEESPSSRPSPRNQRRREQAQEGGVDLGTALSGQYSPISKGKGLGALASRRNVFMQGKEEWPLATSGGLSMEYTPDNTSFEKNYEIVHNSTYEHTQSQFRMCVESMQPQNMIQLLMLNPYHIATLLQVSEIAKHQGDHSVSGDLLERALFNFGRSVHSTFPMALREGTARLEFDTKPKNRELYLTIWRNIKNFEMRGTWKTAFEWSKVLLQLQPMKDPYGVTLMIDQLALRGRQHSALIELCSDDGYGQTWAHLPNIQASIALAYLRSSQPKLARKQLAIAMHKYPYMLSALASALEITPLPSALWGKTPSTEAEKLYTELYVTRAKDLWNTPEATALIGEVAETLEHYSDAIRSAQPAKKLEISLEEARHIMLLEIPHLIALLPRRFTTMPTSSSDVLPPPNSESPFTQRAPGTASGPGVFQAIASAAGDAAAVPLAGANGMLTRILEWFQRPATANEVLDANGETDGQSAFRQLGEALGGEVPPEMVEELMHLAMRTGDDGDVDSAPPIAVGFRDEMGDFDYYLEGAHAPSDESDEDDLSRADSMPSLESIPAEGRSEDDVRNPHAATVEEDEDEDEDAGPDGGRPAPAHGILRRVDSEDEDDSPSQATPQHPRAPNPIVAPFRPLSTTQPTSSTQPTPSQPTEADVLNINDPQRVQRWLLSTGLGTLQTRPNSLDDYVEKLKVLRKPLQAWTINIVKQRAGKDLADRISQAMG